MSMATTQLTPSVQVSAADQSLEQRILYAQASALLRTAQSPVLIAIMMAVGLWSVFYYHSSHTNVLIWACIMHPIQLGLLLYPKLLKTSIEKQNPLFRANLYCNILVLMGIVWGLAPWMFPATGSLPLSAVMTAILLGANAAAINAWAVYQRAIYSSSLPMVIGLGSALLWQGSVEDLFLVVGLLLFQFISLHYAIEQNRKQIQDLKNRYEQEDQVKHLTEQVCLAEHANIEKSRFLASASHDLRQPLHSIALFGTALQSKLKSTADETLARSLMICVEALESSFNSMLDISKLDAGVIMPKMQPVSLTNLFQQLANDYGRQAEGLGLSLRFKPGGKWTYADPVLLKRLLGNLVHNALKFTQSGGAVIVVRSRNNDLSVEVWDTGKGIAANELPRIFDEFYQLDNPERDRSKGLGMGLSIVKRLAKLLDMSITVRSVVNHGTVFKIQMPAASPPAVQKAPSPRYIINSAKHGLRGKHILVVDDDESVRNSTAEILRLHDMHVETASGIEQALEIIQRPDQTTDMLITDLRLRGEENGIQLVTEVNRRIGHEIPALLITGDVAPERIHLVQQSGLKVLYKPIKVDDLLEALHARLV